MEQFQMDLAGRTLTIETGELAKQAGGAVMVGYGDTRVLVTATGSKEAKDIDFFPLTVDYEEKMYAVGRLPGGFIKREARPPESAILNSRLIDRPIRPLFDKGVRNEVHVVATVMSVDQDCDPAICGMIGASAALSISDIPWNGPIAGVRMGRINGEFVVNPTKEQLEATDLNIVVAGTKDAILMVEGGAQEVPEETILEVIMAAHEEIKKIVAFQEDMKAKVGKEKRVFESKDVPAEIADAVRAYGHDKLDAAVRCADKQQRDAQESEVRADVLAHFEEIYPDNLADVNKALNRFKPEIIVMNTGAARVLAFKEPIIMGKEDVEHMVKAMPNSQIVAVHLDSVNHATVTSKDLREFIKAKNIEKNEIKKLYEEAKSGKIDYSSKIIEEYHENGNLKTRLIDNHVKEKLEEYDENGKLIRVENGE